MNKEEHQKHIEREVVHKYEEIMEHRTWLDKIPFMQFPKDWEIQIIPPFGGALIRFAVRKNNVRISAYLDCYDVLGLVGSPYWEIYPYEGDTFRCGIQETGELIEAIGFALNEENKPNE